MEIEQPINDKVKEYCHYCVCKSCEDVQRLQTENAKLNAIIDGYQPKLQALKDAKDKYYQQTLDDEIQINELYEENEQLKTRLKLYIKAYKIIQEIKGIAKNNMIGCFSDKCDLADEILQKITKGE